MDAAMLVGALGGLAFAMSDQVISRLEAGIFLAVFAVYTLSVFRRPHLAAEDDNQEHSVERPVLAVVLGGLAIVGGANLVLYGAEALAMAFGLNDGVVGFVILALGTSLPELAAGVSSARKGHAEIGLGNVVGSNLFNTLAVVGIAGLVKPFEGAEGSPWIETVDYAQGIDIFVNLGFTAALFTLPFIGKSRGKALVLLVAWLVYMVTICDR